LYFSKKKEIMMRKLTLLSVFALGVGITFAQSGKQFPVAFMAKTKSTNKSVQPTQLHQTKAEGDIVWENDFSTPGDWTTGNNSEPTVDWSIGTAGPTGDFSDGMGAIESTSGGNFAMFDSDALGNDASVQNSWIRNTNPIVLTGFPAVNVQFESYYRAFQGFCYLEVSTDLTNWTTYPVHASVAVNASTPNPQVVSINVSAGIGNSATAYIRFRYEGGWDYAWMVDDVKIVEAFDNDLVLEKVFTSLGSVALQYTKIPVSQVNAESVVSFGAEASNVGSQSQNTVLTVTNSAGYSQATSPLTMAPLAMDSLSILVANGYTIPATVGTYNFNFTLTSNNTLSNTVDDQLVFPFEVTTNVMAVDTYNGTPASLSGGFFGWATADGDPGIGTIFEIFNNAQLQRVKVGIAAVATANQEDYIGNELFVQLYKYSADLEDYEFVAISNTVELTAANFGQLVNLDFANPISLTAGDVILPIASFFDGSVAPVAFAGMSFAGTTLGLAGGDLVSLSPTGDLVEAPVVRLDFSNIASVEESTLASNNVVLYPNPTSNEATIAFTLNNDAAVSIEIRDLSGKVVYTSNEGQLAAGAHNTTLSTVSFASGMYTYSVSANGAVVTNKFIVKK
jgi:hypothetical protein